MNQQSPTILFALACNFALALSFTHNALAMEQVSTNVKSGECATKTFPPASITSIVAHVDPHIYRAHERYTKLPCLWKR